MSANISAGRARKEVTFAKTRRSAAIGDSGWEMEMKESRREESPSFYGYSSEDEDGKEDFRGE